MTSNRHHQLQDEAHEIDEALDRQQGTTLNEVWAEALELQPVRCKTTILPPPEDNP